MLLQLFMKMNGKECKYRVEDGKIKCYIYTDTDDIEVKSINLK